MNCWRKATHGREMPVSYCGSGMKIMKSLTMFAAAYAAQTEADYGAFLKAIKNGSIKTGSINPSNK